VEKIQILIPNRNYFKQKLYNWTNNIYYLKKKKKKKKKKYKKFNNKLFVTILDNS